MSRMPAPLVTPCAGPEPAQRVLRLGIALLDRRPVEHLAGAGLVDLVEHDVAHRVAVDEARRASGPESTPPRIAPYWLSQITSAARVGRWTRTARSTDFSRDSTEKNAISASSSTSTRCDRPPANVSARQRLGEATVERDHVRHVVLVAVGVDHDEDQTEPGKDVEELAADELRVLERHLRREQGLGHAAGCVHRVQAQVP